jgi:hypothetical protein
MNTLDIPTCHPCMKAHMQIIPNVKRIKLEKLKALKEFKKKRK